MYTLAENGNGNISQIAVSSGQGHLNEPYFNFNYLLLGTYLGLVTASTYDTLTGNVINSKTFSFDNKAGMPIIHSTPDNGYIIVATGNWAINSSTGYTVFFLIKTDDQFNIQWQQKHNSIGKTIVINDLIVQSDGYELLGFISFATNDKLKLGACHIKMDLSGNVVD